MQAFRIREQDDAAQVSWGVSVLLVSDAGSDGAVARKLAGLGGQVEVVPELYSALSQMIDDPRTAQILMIECDAFGGLAAGRRAFALLDALVERLPVVLISSDCAEQTYPDDRRTPIVLRAPTTMVALRLALETAFQAGHPARL